MLPPTRQENYRLAKYKCSGFRRKHPDGTPYCNYEADSRWLGPCPVEKGGCGRYYDIIIPRPEPDLTKMTLATLANIKPPERMSTGCKEMDYVIGGGIVPGSTLVLTGPPGQGKCLHPDTPLRSFDGSTVRNGDVRVGDHLLGPDSTPRHVLSTIAGRGPLRRVVPATGDPWVCNDVHVLTLINESTSEVFDIPLDEFTRRRGWEQPWKLLRADPTARKDLSKSVPLPFHIEDAGVGDYFGFTLDGDGRFLLGDCTVTHNTTVLLQASDAVAKATGKPVLYSSGEQNAEDIGLFASRLKIENTAVNVRGNEGDCYKITAEAERMKPALIIVDSAQTAFISDVGGDVGSSEQLKAITNWLTSFGKVEKVAVIIVMHVTKENELSGPRAVEHLVDTILFLENYEPQDEEDDEEGGGAQLDETYLKSLREFNIGKNRFGPPGRSAVVEMSERGIITPTRLVSSRIVLAG